MRKIIIIVLCAALLSGCAATESRNADSVTEKGNEIITKSEDERETGMLSGLVYQDNKEECEYTVFLQENSKDVPYLVLSGDFSGGCLLVRRNLCSVDEINHEEINGNNKGYIIYDDETREDIASSYYRGSSVDKYLNGAFYDVLGEKEKASLVEASITITAEKGIGFRPEAGPEDYCTKVFLLSYSDVTEIKSTSTVKEGKTLPYFGTDERRKATFSDGSAGSYWLRTPDTGYYNAAYIVETDGVPGYVCISVGETKEVSGLRPAMVLKSDTKVTPCDGGYVLAE